MDSSTYMYDENIRPINKIEFAIWSGSEIKNGSALGKDSIGVNIPDLYDNMEPKKNGLIDTRFGTSDHNMDCDTCGLKSIYCVGHFGHIDLAVPVFHMGFINYVKKILSCVCLKCSKLLIYKNEDELMEMLKNKTGKARFAEIIKIVKNVSYCQKPGYGCGTPKSKIKLEIKKSTVAVNIISETNLSNIPTEDGSFSGKKKIRQILTPENCYNIFKNISDIDCEIMGIDPKKSRPEMMILKIFPVPPVAVRPSVRADFLSSSTMEDDLTHKLADIVKSNIRVRKYKEKVNEIAKYTQDHVHLLQYHVITYYANDSISVPRAEQRGKPTKSLSSRLKGKNGRIRGNLMGKRVNFSARTVITPDPTIDINQLGIPLKTAMDLTFPEVVTPENIDKLQELVNNGRDIYPGANYVFPMSSLQVGKRVMPIDLRYGKEKVSLRYGDIVERHLVDDDYVLLNRQPTLHKLSMMGHRIKVNDNNDLSTFRLNVAVTTPYNADFDGDEMNIFVPQSVQTMIELAEIADVKRQLITPRLSTPIIGIVQDGLLGAYNLTYPTMKIDWREAMNLISYTTINDFSPFKKKQDMKGSDLFSLIIPNKISMFDRIEIKNGKLINGQISKSQLGAKKANSLIHLIWDEYGIKETKNFIDNIQRLINNFNLFNGFTVGIGDVYMTPELDIKIQKIFETKKLEVKHLITEMENNPDLMDEEMFEQEVYAKLNAIRGDVSGLIMKILKDDNNFNIMISSGSKGSPINMGQMTSCIGQQAVEGKRIKKNINGRALAYFAQNDDSASARGFIQDSFLRGMGAINFIFHNMSSREGLIDTAIKSVVGDTPIIIIENNNIKRVLIGDWIDNLLNINNNKVKHYEEREMELLELSQKVYIPTTDENGNVSWSKISNITRHLPGKELYKINTLSGREVIVTESKSLLIWNKETQKLEQKNTPQVVIGDCVPVTKFINKLPKNIIIKSPKNINTKELPDNLCLMSKEYQYNFLRMYISQNGIFKNDYILIKFSKLEHLEKINMLLNMFDIFALIKKIENEFYIQIKDQSFHKIIQIINKGNVIKYKNKVQSINKQNKYDIELSDNFKEHNDIVLDKIVSITKVDIELYPKVYDLTVPKTLNFGLANGLHVVDTAESGYIQRKLIKSMEDAVVKYDLTIRNANDSIIQFFYGDSGINTTRQYGHRFKTLSMGNKEIAEIYKFTDKELQNFPDYSKKENEEYYQKFLLARDQLRKAILKFSINNIILNDKFMLPVNFYKILNPNDKTISEKRDKLSPKYIVDRLRQILQYEQTMLSCMSKKDAKDKKSIKYKDEKLAKTIFRYSLFEYLSPKICINKINLSKNQFDEVCNKIINSFNKSVIPPGDMVGCIAAQSIGEPVTQMSVSKDTNIHISGEFNYNGPIGEFIDRLMKERKNKVIDLGNDSTVLNLNENNYKIIGVDENEKIHWNKITQVSKHPANGNLVKITTQSGKTTTATLSHSFLKRVTDGIIPIKGSNLKVGDRIPITKYIPIVNNPYHIINIGEKEITLDKTFGWFCGIYLAQGTINGTEIIINNIDEYLLNKIKIIANRFNINVNHENRKQNKSIEIKCEFLAEWLYKYFGTNINNKQIPSFLYSSNEQFICGFLQGYINEQNINCNEKLIKIKASERLIDNICVLLSYFKIFTNKKLLNQNDKIHVLEISRKYINKFINDIDTNIDYKNTEIIDKIPELGNTIKNISDILKLSGNEFCENINNKYLIDRKILKKYIHIFREKNEFTENPFDKKKIYNFIQILEQAAYSDIVWDEIIKLEYIKDNGDYVYDFTVPGNNTFMVDAGILVHNTLNTFHSAGIGGMGTTTLGVPRMKELLSFSKNMKTPVMMIHLLNKYSKDKEIAEKIASSIKHTTIKDIRRRIDVYYNSDPNKKGGFMEKDNVYNPFYSNNPTKYSCQSNITGLPWLMRIELDKELMMEKEITLLDIKSKFCHYWGNRYSETRGIKREDRQLLDKITQCAILSNNDSSEVPIIHLRFSMKDFNFGTLISFLDNFIENFKLKGIASIEKIINVSKQDTVNFDNDDKKLETIQEHIIYTSGINLKSIRYINGIDLTKTSCNDIVQVYDMFGIEAARSLLLKELKTVFEGAGNSVNYQHISVLVDIMTNNGSLTSIDRHGLNRLETDPLSRASFEKTVDQFITAAVFGEVDHMNSVSSRIMTGSVIKGGTGLCEIVLDTDLLENSEYIEDIEHKYRKTFTELSTSSLMDDVLNKEDTNIFVPE